MECDYFVCEICHQEIQENEGVIGIYAGHGSFKTINHTVCHIMKRAADKMKPKEPEQEWPKEPWTTYLEASVQYFLDADGKQFCEPIDFDHDTLTPERIVACVNACAGMVDPAKEITDLKEKAWKYAGLG